MGPSGAATCQLRSIPNEISNEPVGTGVLGVDDGVGETRPAIVSASRTGRARTVSAHSRGVFREGAAVAGTEDDAVHTGPWSPPCCMAETGTGAVTVAGCAPEV